MFLSKRNGVYYLWYDDNGSRRKLSTGTKSKSEALTFLSTFNRKDRSKVEDPGTVQTGTSPRLSIFQNEFIEYSETIHTSKTTKHHRTALNEFKRIAGNRYLSEITVRDIEKFIGQKKTESSDYSALKYFSALRTSFDTAVRWGMIAQNPFLKVKRPKVVEVRPAYFTREQFDKLMSVIDESEIRDIAIFGVSTGMRLAEISSLRWRDVDQPSRVINVVNYAGFTTKTKRSRTIPISTGLFRLLERRSHAAGGELVFHNSGKQWRDVKLSAKFKRYVRKAGLQNELKFHSLRHTFASWLVQSGVSLYEVSRLLGHTTVRMSEKYAHLQTDKLHSTVEKIAVNSSLTYISNNQ